MKSRGVLLALLVASVAASGRRKEVPVSAAEGSPLAQVTARLDAMDIALAKHQFKLEANPAWAACRREFVAERENKANLEQALADNAAALQTKRSTLESPLDYMVSNSQVEKRMIASRENLEVATRLDVRKLKALEKQYRAGIEGLEHVAKYLEQAREGTKTASAVEEATAKSVEDQALEVIGNSSDTVAKADERVAAMATLRAGGQNATASTQKLSKTLAAARTARDAMQKAANSSALPAKFLAAAAAMIELHDGREVPLMGASVEAGNLQRMIATAMRKMKGTARKIAQLKAENERFQDDIGQMIDLKRQLAEAQANAAE